MQINSTNPIYANSQPFLASSSEKKTSFCDRIKEIPVIGHVILAIIWLFKKIFPCCFASDKPAPITQRVKYPIKTESTPVSVSIPKETPALNSSIVNPPAPSLSQPVSTKPQIAPIVPVKIVPVDLGKVLEQPNPLKKLLLYNLSNKDLKALDIAIKSDKSANATQDPNRINLLKIAKEIPPKRDIEKALYQQLHFQREWKSVYDAWNVSLEDKAWLLELHKWHYWWGNRNITEIAALYPNEPDQKKHVPCDRSPELLVLKDKVMKKYDLAWRDTGHFVSFRF